MSAPRAGGSGFLALVFALALFNCASAVAAPPPNVLFIVTDDQALETMNVSDPALDPMRKTKRWFHTGGTSSVGPFEGGTFFRQAVATTPLCCPARASILTGRYAHNHGVKDTFNSPGPPTTNQPTGASALDKRTTLARYLHDAGYYTGLFGKYLNGWNLSDRPDAPYPNWDEWAVFDNFGTPSGFEVGEQGVRKYVFQYETDYVADKALDFVRRTKANSDSVPWFMYLAPTAPHSPFAAAPRHAKAPVPGLDENDPAYFEPDRRDKPPWAQTSLVDAQSPKRGWDPHMRMLRAIDDMVDSVMTELQSQGEDRNTIAFFVSDNGFLWGEHGLYNKNMPYSESIRIPFLLRWPDGPVARNATTDRLVANVDMATTVVDAVNDAFGGPVINPDPGTPMDGMSLIDPAQRDRDVVLTEGWGRGPPAGTRGYCTGVFPTWAGLTAPSFHYVEHYETRALPFPGQTTPPSGCAAREYETLFGSTVFKEYYDTRPGRDPEELTNLLADDNVSPVGTVPQLSRLNDDGAPENDPPTATLAGRLAQLRTCAGASCRPQAKDPPGPPLDVAITGKPSDPSGLADFALSFTSTEPDATFHCQLDGGPNTMCSSPRQYSKLANGRHRFRVTATLGARTDTETYEWMVDRDLPDSLLTAKPRKSSTSDQATFEWDASGSAGAFECKLDGQAAAPCTSPHTYNGLADGEHTVSVTALAGGVRDDSPATFTWQIDTRAPDTQLTRTNTFSTRSTGATFNIARTFASGDVGFVGRFDCQLDGGAWEPCDTPKTYLRLPSGHRTLRVKTTDVAGNEDVTPATDAWDIGPIQVFGTSPDTRWPEISEGTEVRDIVPDGSGGWFVGGDFTKVRDALGEHNHTDLVHIKSNMTVDNAWNPETNGTVRALGLSPDRTTLYIGGTFTSVTGTNQVTVQRGRLAALSVATGDPNAWSPDASNDVNALVIPPVTSLASPVSTLYVAGAFQLLKSSEPPRITRRKLAEIPLTGDGTPTAWNPSVDTAATLNALAATERHVYAGGYMTAIGGSPSTNPLVQRRNVAAVDRFDGRATSWAPNPNNQVLSLELRNRVSGLDTIYVGGSFSSIGSPAVSRSGAAEVNLSDTGSVADWSPSPATGAAPGTVRAFMSFTCPVFAGIAVNDPACATLLGGGFDSVQATASTRVTRNRLSQTDRETGLAHDWNPNLNGTAFAMACWPSPDVVSTAARCDNSLNRVLAVGGSFTQANGVARARLAFFARP